jgi:cell volume regulation protein A
LVEDKILIAGAVLLLAVLSAIGTMRLRLPFVLAFLGLGMLLGSEGLGGIYFDDVELARSIGVVALIVILFEGGLTTEWRDLRAVLAPALLLSTVGVVVTAAVTAAAAYFFFDLSWITALLLGAIVGSTDAAAVFATLRFTPLRRRVATLLAAESGANDPMAVALTAGFISWLTIPAYGAEEIAIQLLRELGLGLVIGVGLGLIASRAFARLPPELGAFAPVASVATAGIAYGVADAAHASGFLCVYVVALWIGNTPMALRRTVVAFHEGIAFLAQVVLFIFLGLLVFPSQLGSVALASLALAGVLVFVARPLAVLLSTVAAGFGRRERLFLSWAGLRGAVPIVLATFALSADIAASQTIFNAVFFVVIVSTLVQGTTIEPLARRLRLATEPRPYHQPPIEIGVIQSLGGEILEFQVAPGDALVGSFVRDTGLPRSAIVMLIVRDGSGIPPRGTTRIEAGDRLYILATAEARAPVEQLLVEWERGAAPTRLRLASRDR